MSKIAEDLTRGVGTISIVLASITTTAFLLTLFILSGFWRKDLFNMGAEFIYYYQNPPSDFVRIVYNIIALFGESFIVGPVMGLAYILVYRKLNAMVYIILVLFNVYLIAVTKQGFQDPRPFWQYSQIQYLGWTTCLTQYGYPSGHSWVSVLLFEPLLSDFIGLGPFKWAFAFVAFTGCFIPFSRLYLGVHSLDQVITGLAASIGFIIIYRYLLQKQIFRFLHRCLTRPNKRIVFSVIAFQLLVIAVPIILFEVNTSYWQLDPIVLQNLNNACNADYTVYTLEKKHSLGAALVHVIFGLIYGILIAKKSGRKRWWIKYYYGDWQYGKKLYVVYKLILYVVFLGLGTALFVIVIPIWVDNFYGAYALQIFGFIVGGLVIAFLVPFFAEKWGIISQRQQTPIERIQSQAEQNRVSLE